MKKKTLGLLAAVLSVCMLAGCGAKDTGDGAATESTALKDMDVDKYVTPVSYTHLFFDDSYEKHRVHGN